MLRNDQAGDVMDLIGVMLSLFLNFSDGCSASPAEARKVNGEQYQVLAYDCGTHHWQVWQHECVMPNGTRYYGRPYFLTDADTSFSFYLNRFGELQGGYGALIQEAYLPLCGS